MKYSTILYYSRKCCTVRTDIGFEAVGALQLMLNAHYSFVIYTDIGLLSYVKSLIGWRMVWWEVMGWGVVWCGVV